MNEAQSIIDEVRSIGGFLVSDHGKLGYYAPQERLAAIMPCLKAYKSAILAELETEGIHRGEPFSDLANFSERAAIFEHSGGLYRKSADLVAALELGYISADAFYEAALLDWRQKLRRNGENLTTQRGKQTLRDAVAFLEEWGLTALQMGWDEQDLFRCTSHDLQAIGALSLAGKKPQLQRLGLIFFIQDGRVDLITHETASIRTSGGQLQSFPRFGPGHNQGAPIWEVIEKKQVRVETKRR